MGEFFLILGEMTIAAYISLHNNKEIMQDENYTNHKQQRRAWWADEGSNQKEFLTAKTGTMWEIKYKQWELDNVTTQKNIRSAEMRT